VKKHLSQEREVHRPTYGLFRSKIYCVTPFFKKVRQRLTSVPDSQRERIPD
jgi:hypothetical protein